MEASKLPPDLDDVLAELKNEIFAQLNCVQIGKIATVNSNQTCEVNIQFKRRLNGDEITAYPKLVDCPYFVLSGGGSYLDMPISVGDYCLVLFNDRNIDDWWDTANIVEPSDRRKHNLSDGIVLVGIQPKSKALSQDGTYVRLLGTSGEGNEAFAARLGDSTLIDSTSDSVLITWIATISAAINALAPGAITTVPTTITGKISGGSMEVKIG